MPWMRLRNPYGANLRWPEYPCVLLCQVDSQIKVRVSDEASRVIEVSQVFPDVLWNRFAP